jgi:RNA polymerase sigma-70 factor (ECF subfamily)
MVMALAPVIKRAEPVPVGEARRSELRVEHLYAEHVATVWRGLRRLGVPESSVEDAVQDVFLVAHRRLADFEGRSTAKAWLYGILLRVAKDYRRARTRQVHGVERFTHFLSASSTSGQTPIDDAERREANRTLHAVLSALDEAHREVFVLVELEDFSVREAAAVLRLHLRACQRRLRTAREAFERNLARHHCSVGGKVP